MRRLRPISLFDKIKRQTSSQTYGGQRTVSLLMVLCLLLLFLAFSLVPASVTASTVSPTVSSTVLAPTLSVTSDLPHTLSLSPADPTIADRIILAVEGAWQNACTPQFSTVTIFPGDHVVRVDAISNLEEYACGQAVTPYTLSAELQLDLAGTYQVFYYVQDGPLGKPEPVANTTVDVAGGLRISPRIVVVDEPVEIVISDIASTLCTPDLDGHIVDGETIFIDLLSNQGSESCGTAATPWSHALTLTDLPAGIYSVQVRVIQVEEGLRIGSRIAYQLPLTVLDELHQIFLPLMLALR